MSTELLDLPDLPGGSVSVARTVVAVPGASGGPAVAYKAQLAAGLGSATPLIDGTATAGTSTSAAHEDHVHPTDTTRYAASNPAGYQTALQVTTSINTALSGYASTSSVTSSISTAVSGLATASSVSTEATARANADALLLPLAGGTMTGLLTLSGAPSANLHAATKLYVDTQVSGVSGGGTPSSATPLMDGVGAAGSSTNYARGDHVHPVDTSRYAASNPSGYQTASQVNTAIQAVVGAAPTALDTLVEIATQLQSDETAAGALTTAVGLKAPIASPTFTGTVTIPAGAAISGYAALASPAFTGVPTAPTATAGTNTTQVATTAFVTAAVASATAGVASFNTRTGTVTLTTGDVTAVLAAGLPVANGGTGATTAPAALAALGAAPLASPTFTGTVTSPAFSGPLTGSVTGNVSGTAANVTGTVAIANGGTGATSANAALTALGGAALGSVTPLIDGTAAIGTATTAAHSDHVHPTDTSRAPLASPAFTGSITLPTWTTGTRPGSPAAGMEGFATDTTRRETYNGSAWVQYVRTGDLPSATTSQLYGGTGAAGAAEVVALGTNLTMSFPSGVPTLNAASGGAAAFVKTAYAAAGAIATTDDMALVTLSSAGTMTLANGSVDDKLIRIKNMGSITVSLTAKIDGTTQTVVLQGTGTVKDSITLRMNTTTYGSPTWIAE